MKIKSLAKLVMTGVVAASCVYLTPAIADDMGNAAGQGMQSQSSADNSMTGGNMPGMSDSSSDSGYPGSSNDLSPDTASGDDDY